MSAYLPNGVYYATDGDGRKWLVRYVAPQSPINTMFHVVATVDKGRVMCIHREKLKLAEEHLQPK